MARDAPYMYHQLANTRAYAAAIEQMSKGTIILLKFCDKRGSDHRREYRVIGFISETQSGWVFEPQGWKLDVVLYALNYRAVAKIAFFLYLHAAGFQKSKAVDT